MSVDASGAPKRDANGGFVAGTCGRPFGTRNRVSKRVAQAILSDFEAHQDALLIRLRRWYLPQYMAAVSKLLPRPGDGESAPDDLAEGDVAGLVARTRAALDRIEAGEATLAELEAALLGAGEPG